MVRRETPRGTESSCATRCTARLPENFRVSLFRLCRSAALGLATALSGCRADNAASDRRELHLKDPQVAKLALTLVDPLALGSPADGVFSVTDFEIHGGNVYIVDEMAKTVHVFNASGERIRTLGREGSGLGARIPASVAFSEEDVLVSTPARESASRCSATTAASSRCATSTPPPRRRPSSPTAAG